MFDVTYSGAVFAGMLSFLSPCILPMVPFYLTYLAGSEVKLATAEGASNFVPDSRLLVKNFRPVIGALVFSAGIITVFVALGASASVAGQIFRDWFDVFRYVAAGIIIIMGLHFLGILRIGFLYRSFKIEPKQTTALSLPMAYVIGLAFAFGWTPCVGPVLAAILFVAAGMDTMEKGIWLLVGYGIGMTLPFVLAAAFVSSFMKLMNRYRKYMVHVERMTGAFLLLFGILIATNTINHIAQWMIDTFPIFTAIG